MRITVIKKDIKALKQSTHISKILQIHFKMFYRRQSLRTLAPGSPQVGDHQVQAKDQENLRCWQGRWRGWTWRTQSCSPPCCRGIQSGIRIKLPIYFFHNVTIALVLVGTNLDCRKWAGKRCDRHGCWSDNRQSSQRAHLISFTWSFYKAGGKGKDHSLGQDDWFLHTKTFPREKEQPF